MLLTNRGHTDIIWQSQLEERCFSEAGCDRRLLKRPRPHGQPGRMPNRRDERLAARAALLIELGRHGSGLKFYKLVTL